MNSFESTIEVGHNELEIEVNYDYNEFYSGDRGPYGEPTTPEEPAYAEITTIQIIDPKTRVKREGTFLLEFAGESYIKELESEALADHACH